MSDAEPLGDVARRIVDDINWRTRMDCVHHRLQVRQKRMSDGRVMFKRQCTYCGAGVGTAVAAADVKDKSALWDQESEDAYNRIYEDRAKEQEAQRNSRKDQWWADYNRYLNSQEWRVRREAVLDRDGYECQACPERRRATEVHHLTYSHVFNEPLFELVAVCRTCHDQLTTLDRDARASSATYEEPNEQW